MSNDAELDILTLIEQKNIMVKPFTYCFVSGKRLVNSWISGYADSAPFKEGQGYAVTGKTLQEAVSALLSKNTRA